MTARPAAGGGAVLYTPAVLALAVELARYPLTDNAHLRGRAQSRVCGSAIELDLTLAADGAISHCGARVTACAIGQAAAALFLAGAPGRDRMAIATARSQFETWLAAGGPLPDWPGLDVIAPASGYPARHAAILLPWRAALVALSNAAPAD